MICYTKVYMYCRLWKTNFGILKSEFAKFRNQFSYWVIIFYLIKKYLELLKIILTWSIFLASLNCYFLLIFIKLQFFDTKKKRLKIFQLRRKSISCLFNKSFNIHLHANRAWINILLTELIWLNLTALDACQIVFNFKIEFYF